MLFRKLTPSFFNIPCETSVSFTLQWVGIGETEAKVVFIVDNHESPISYPKLATTLHLQHPVSKRKLRYETCFKLFTFTENGVTLNPKSMGGGGNLALPPPSIFLALNFLP